MEVVTIITTATTTTHVAEGKDKPRVMAMAPTLVCLDCLVATTAVTVGGGRDARLLERTRLVSDSLVWKTSWEEEITAAVTVDTTREDTIKDTIKQTIKEDTTKGQTRDSTRDSTNRRRRSLVSVTTS